MRFRLCIGLLVLFSLAFSQQEVDKNVYVTADAFELRTDEQVVFLSKNVQIMNHPYRFYSNLVKYDYNKDIFNFYDDFSIVYNAQVIDGKNLELNNKTKILTANNVFLTFDKYYIKGDKLTTLEDRYHLENAKVTACDGDPPFFYISSGQMVMYPKLGFIVVFNSFFYIYNIPVFYLPAYFMGGHTYSKISEFIPEIGSNRVEGNYVKERIPYYIDSRNSGSVFLGYLENFGPKIGVEHYIILGPKNILNTSLYYSTKLVQAGAEYSYEFFQQQENTSGYLFWYLFDERKLVDSSLKFKAKVYQKELIHDWFVDQTPKLSLEGVYRMDSVNTLKGNYEYAILNESDYVTNASDVSSYRRQTSVSLLTELRLGPLRIDNELATLLAIYSDRQHNRHWNTVKFSIPFDIFRFSIGSELLLGFNGDSPFKHDLYETGNDNNLLYGMTAHLPYFIFEFDAKRKWSGDFYHRRYTFKLPFYNCVDFSFSYDDIKNQFGVVFKI